METAYILNDKHEVVAVSAQERAAWYDRDPGAVRVGYENIGRYIVSTAFLGEDTNEGIPGKPAILFESMIYGGKLNKQRKTAATWEEAEANHKAMVEQVRAVVKEEPELPKADVALLKKVDEYLAGERKKIRKLMDSMLDGWDANPEHANDARCRAGMLMAQYADMVDGIDGTLGRLVRVMAFVGATALEEQLLAWAKNHVVPVRDYWSIKDRETKEKALKDMEERIKQMFPGAVVKEVPKM